MSVGLLLSGLIVAGAVQHASSKQAYKLAPPAKAAVLSAESSKAQATPTQTASPTPSPVPTPKPVAKRMAAPRVNVKPVAAIATPMPTLAPPYTCYTFAWGDKNWWIAYRYDVTPKPDGTLDVVYQGGGSWGFTKLPDWPFPDMCPYNRRPSLAAPPSPGSGIYSDSDPH